MFKFRAAKKLNISKFCRVPQNETPIKTNSFCYSLVMTVKIGTDRKF